MKKFKRIALVLAFACLMSLVFSSCDMLKLGGFSAEIEDSAVDEDGIDKIEIVDGDLVITLADGSVVNMGPIDDSKGTLGLEFYPLPDGTYAVSIGKAAFLKQIVIPSTYKGCSVTRIVDYGFANSKIERITIPSSITYIGEGAFWGCSNLGAITFDGSVSKAENLGVYGWNNNGHHNVSVNCNNGIFTGGANDPANGDETEEWIEDESEEWIEDETEEWTDDPYEGGLYGFRETAEYYDGEYVSVWKSTNAYIDDSSCVMTTYAGRTGYMTFDYKVSSETNFDILKVYVNGNQVLSASGESGYTGFSCYVNYGDYIVFEYSKDSSESIGEDCAYIRNIQFGQDVEIETEEEPESWSEEEIESFEFCDFWEYEEYYNGEYVTVYKSSNKSDNSASQFGMVADADGCLAFDYKVSSESNYDRLLVYVNDTVVFDASGETGYQSFEYNVSRDDLIIIEYRKDVSQSAGDDCAYVYNLRIE